MGDLQQLYGRGGITRLVGLPGASSPSPRPEGCRKGHQGLGNLLHTHPLSDQLLQGSIDGGHTPSSCLQVQEVGLTHLQEGGHGLCQLFLLHSVPAEGRSRPLPECLAPPPISPILRTPPTCIPGLDSHYEQTPRGPFRTTIIKDM